MKTVQLILAVVLVLTMATSFGFASGTTGTRTTGLSSLGGPQELIRDLDGPRKTGVAPRNINWEAAKPQGTRTQTPSGTLAVIPAGTYSIPGPYGASIAAVVGYLNGAGIDGLGPVTFTLSGSYTEPAGSTFLNYAGNSQTVTFRPAGATPVAIHFTATASQGKGFAFNGAKNVTFNGKSAAGTGSMSLDYVGGTFPASDLFAATFYITGSSDHITIKNSTVSGNILGAYASQTDGRPAVFMFVDQAISATMLNTNITVDSCVLGNATYGVLCTERYQSTYPFIQTANHVSITNNTIGTPTAKLVQSVLLEGAFDVHYDNNTVSNIEVNDYYWNNGTGGYDGLRTFATSSFFFNFGQYSGGHLYNTDATSTALNNQITDVHWNGGAEGGFLVYGLVFRISNGGRSLAANNRISGIVNSDPAGQTIGLRISNQNIFHNTISLTGALPGTGALSTGLNNDGASVIKNNIFSNTTTGSTAANTRGINVAGAVATYNDIYCPTGRSVSGFATDNAAIGAGENVNGVFSSNPFLLADLHVDNTQASSASNMGNVGVLPATDIDGQARPLDAAPDAGADEFTGAPNMAIDVFPSVPVNPGAGIPASVAQTPTCIVKNNSNVATGSFNVTLHINDGVYVDNVQAVSLAPNASTTVTFGNWTASGGTWTLTVTTSLSDANNANNVATKSVVATPPTAIVGSVTYDWNASASGWTGAVDFIRSSTFTKLGGVYGGSGSSWVTVMGGASATGDKSTYTEGAFANLQGYAATYPGANFLTSPFLDLSGMGAGNDLYISFNHSMAIEPGWDASWVQYTTDGVNWHHLGTLNDPNGINWYSSSVYQNNPSWDATGGGPPDLTTLGKPGYDLYPSSFTPPEPWWTSNGDAGPPVSVADETGEPQGPFGWVFTQLHVTNPAISRAPVIRFRYVAFSDAVNPVPISVYHTSQGGPTPAAHLGGWAVDNFRLGTTGAVFPGGTISGTVFQDNNGNGANNTEPAEVGVKVYLTYFGVLTDSTTTDGSGAYSFGPAKVKLPGSWGVQAVVAGKAYTTANPNVADNPADGSGASTQVRDIGTFVGSISGKKWNDINKNGALDGGEPGLEGWTIELHRDSCNGALVQSASTDANGNYSFNVVPGTWYLKEVLQANWVKTFPGTPCNSVTTSGASGSGTANATGVNFGNWQLGCLTVKKTVDLNGNGIVDAGDVTGLPAGAIAVVTTLKNGSPLFIDTLGNNAVISVQHCGLDQGTYTTTETFVTPGWIMTFGGAPFTFVVSTSGQTATSQYLNFKPPTWTGHKWTDINGNGTQDAGEPNEANATISVASSGTVVPPAQYMYGPTTVQTDANGDYTITGIGGGSHTVSVIKDPSACGNTLTKPNPAVGGGPAGTYTFGGVNATVPGANHTGLDFGNYKNVSVTVVKYRDRNANQVRDGNEEVLSGWQITATGAGGATQATDGTGSTSFCLGPLNHVITEANQLGWTPTQGNGGYSVTLLSGHDTTLYFGNFLAADSDYAYRTFSADDLEQAAQEKAVKRPKVGKPMTFPNIRNVVEDYFNKKTQGGVITPVIVGDPSVLNAKLKPKVYILLNGTSALLKSMWDKGQTHSTDVDSTEITRGLDVDNSGKLLAGALKGLSPKKQRNDAAEEMIALAFNLALEAKGKIPAGLGSLIYDDGTTDPTECSSYGFPLNGKSVAQIKAIGDGIMTNYAFVPLSCYRRLEEVASKINEAFSCGGVDCETAQEPTVDTAAWRAGTKLSVLGIYPAAAASYLHNPAPGAAPYTVPVVAPILVPDKYSLYQNYPNPFNPTTTIEFDLPEAANVSLVIYNTLGQQVTTLFNNEAMDAGNQAVDFDASSLASGIYFYRVVAQTVNDDGLSTGQTFTQVKKMVLMK